MNPGGTSDKKRGKWTMNDRGKWREGPATPRLEPEHLRDKPSELITQDSDNPDAIHKDDPTHIAEAIVHEHFKKQEEKKEEIPNNKHSELKLKSVAKIGRQLRISDLGHDRRQLEIDIVRMRVLWAWVGSMADSLELGQDVNLDEIKHLWFYSDDINDYGWETGLPPRDIFRPKYLRGMKLELDIRCPPERLRRELESMGHKVWWDINPALERLRERVKEGSIRARADMDTIKNL